MRQTLLAVKQGKIPWKDRIRLVPEAITAMRAKESAEDARELLKLLAEDPKWEVRKAVANSILDLPEDFYARYVLRLCADSNAFVQQAVQRGIARRSVLRGTGTNQPGPIKRLLAQIRGKFGDEGVKLAIRLSDKTTELVVRSTVHDIRGIITPINMSLENLQRESDSPVLHTNAERVLSSMHYLERLLNDMRKWASDVDLDLSNEDLGNVLKAAAQEAADHLRNQGRDPSPVVVSIHAPKSLPLEISRAHLQMAFTNLIKNAIEAHVISETSFRKGTVRVNVDRQPEEVRVTVSDTGMGLAPEELEIISEFIPGNTSKKEYGTGYGLAIAKRNIEAHGGRIDLRSRQFEGTTVTVTLPRSNDSCPPHS